MDNKRYIKLYLLEARKHLKNIQVLIGKDLGASEYRELFRLSHNIKGMSAAMERQQVVEAAHELEDLLESFREAGGGIAPSMDDLKRGVDKLALAVELDREKLSPKKEIEDPRPGLVERNLELRLELERADQKGNEQVSMIVEKLCSMGEILVSYCMAKSNFRPFERGVLIVLLVRTSRPIKDVLEEISAQGQGIKIEVTPVADPVMDVSSPGMEDHEGGLLPVEFSTWLRLNRLAQDAALTAKAMEDTKSPQERSLLNEEITSKMESFLVETSNLVLGPIEDLLEILPKAARSIAIEKGKSIDVHVQHDQILLDVRTIERLRDPLLHLVRNAVVHGIEEPSMRLGSGKTSKGNLRIEAERIGSRIRIRIEDDGRGMNESALVAKALELKILDQEDADNITSEEALKLSLMSGLSTGSKVDLVSGRGVGLNSVARAIEDLGGKISIESKQGEYTIFVLWLPAAVFSEPVIIVQEAGQLFCIPERNVKEVGNARPGKIEQDSLTKPLRLSEALGWPNHGSKKQKRLFLKTKNNLMELLVEGILGREITVVKPLGNPLAFIKSLMGFTQIMGRTAFVLDPEYL
ncbi:MAG: hypothetical protein GXP49_03105 [Deltaproteobacteria bacterium]|nr:hypothetical protein [Deltaproteobacteria bacterium]